MSGEYRSVSVALGSVLTFACLAAKLIVTE